MAERQSQFWKSADQTVYTWVNKYLRMEDIRTVVVGGAKMMRKGPTYVPTTLHMIWHQPVFEASTLRFHQQPKASWSQWTAWQHSTSAHKDCEYRAWKEPGITGMPEVSRSYIQKVQSLRVHFRHCIWKSHLLWPLGSPSCVICLEKGLVQGDFHLHALKPQDLWVQLCGKVKQYQLMKLIQGISWICRLII